MRSVVRMRLSCAACLGVALENVAVVPGVSIDHCRRCGGTWILREQTAQLRAVPAAVLRATIARADAAFVCHACHVPMERDAAACPCCSWKNQLDCPECGKAMRRHTERDVTVDVCRGCRAVWLDHHELASIWAVAAAGAVAHSAIGDRLSATGGEPGEFLLEALWHAPDLVYYGARASADAVGAAADAAVNAPGFLAGTPELIAGAAEAAGEAAGGVFSLIAEIIGEILGGLG